MIISIAAANLVATDVSEYRPNKNSVWKKFILAARTSRDKGNIKGGIQLYRKGLYEAGKEGLNAEAPELVQFLERNLWT